LTHSGFDAVIGNPPYYSLTLGRGQEKSDEGTLQYFQEKYPNASDYKINLYALFIERSLGLIGANGGYGVILPSTILTNYYHTNLRRYVLETFLLRRIVDARYRVFSEAEIGGNAVLVIEHAEVAQNTRASVWLAEADSQEDEAIELEQKRFLKVPDVRFVTDFRLISLLEKSYLVSVLYQGIITGDNKKFISSRRENERYKPILKE
jgi:type I restriction-modification system DNA methylase subunit